MKKLLFLVFLLSYVGLPQYIHTVGDTTDLKSYAGSGIVLLEQYGGGSVNGGGLFHRIDSTYAEGTHAFNYSTANGYQWARISLIDDYIELVNGETITNSTNGQFDFSGSFYFSTGVYFNPSDSGTVTFTFTSDDDSLAQIYVKSSNTLVNDNDHMDILFTAYDDSAGYTNYGSIIVTATDVSDESEDSKIEIKTFSAGSQVTPLTLTGNTVTVGALGATTITGSVTATDSTTSAILKDSGGKKWKIKVNTEGVISADSTGLN